MSQFLQPGDHDRIEASSTCEGDRSQRYGAFGDYEKPFPTVSASASPVTVNGPGEVDPGLADPTVYKIQTFRIPEDRKLGYWSTAGVLVFVLVAPAENAKWLLECLFFWSLLERIYKRPKYFVTCVYAVQFVLLGNTVGNAISCAEYFLRTINPVKLEDSKNKDPGNLSEGAKKSIAVGVVTAVCLIHFKFPKFGSKYLMASLATIKIGLILLIIIGGAVAGAGKGTKNPERVNFSAAGAWNEAKTVNTPGNYAMAILGVLGEVRDAPNTLRKSAPIAVILIGVLHILVNIAYFTALPKIDIQAGGIAFTAGFFLDVFGDNVFVTVIIPLCISISAFGNVLAVTFASSRVKQELGKEGALPWSRIWASDKPLGTPAAALLLHWVFSSVIISSLPSASDDAYTFVVLLFTYSRSVVNFFIGIGLLYLRYYPSQRHIWRAERTSYHCWLPFILIHTLASAFLIIAPFIPNKSGGGQSLLTGPIPYWVFTTTSWSVLLLGILYWVGFAKIWPIFGMAVEVDKSEDAAGNEVIRYKHVRRARETHTEGSVTPALSQA